MSIKTRWIGKEGAAFERVGLAFEALGYRAPSGRGEYAINIAAQYVADMDETTALAVIRFGLNNTRDYLRVHGSDFTLDEVTGLYAD